MMQLMVMVIVMATMVVEAAAMVVEAAAMMVEVEMVEWVILHDVGDGKGEMR